MQSYRPDPWPLTHGSSPVNVTSLLVPNMNSRSRLRLARGHAYRSAPRSITFPNRSAMRLAGRFCAAQHGLSRAIILSRCLGNDISNDRSAFKTGNRRNIQTTPCLTGSQGASNRTVRSKWRLVDSWYRPQGYVINALIDCWIAQPVGSKTLLHQRRCSLLICIVDSLSVERFATLIYRPAPPSTGANMRECNFP